MQASWALAYSCSKSLNKSRPHALATRHEWVGSEISVQSHARVRRIITVLPSNTPWAHGSRLTRGKPAGCSHPATATCKLHPDLSLHRGQARRRRSVLVSPNAARASGYKICVLQEHGQRAARSRQRNLPEKASAVLLVIRFREVGECPASAGANTMRKVCVMCLGSDS